MVVRVQELEATLASSSAPSRDHILAELHKLYRLAFEAFRLKGIVGASVQKVGAAASGSSAATHAAS